MNLPIFFILSVVFTATAGILDTEIKLASANELKNRLYEKGYNDFADRTGIADDFADKIAAVGDIYFDLLGKIGDYINNFSLLDPVMMEKEIPAIIFKEWPHLLFACGHYTNHPRVWGYKYDEDEFIKSPKFLEALKSFYIMRSNFTGDL